MKYLKTFEGFDFNLDGEISESLYIQRLYEEYEAEFESMDNDGLTPGERAALSRGMDLMSEEQAAVAYLLAADKSRLIWEAMGVVGLSKTPISAEELSKQIGMKILSFLYAVKKFRIMMGKEDQKGQAIYDKIIKFFNKFDMMTPEAVASIAQGAFTPEAAERGAGYAEDFYKAKEMKGMDKRKMEFDIRSDVNSFANSFAKLGYPYPDAKKKAIARVAKERNLSPMKVEEIAFGKQVR
jgi:hypothetical protein